MCRRPLTVVIAPDSFKGTLRAVDAAQAIASGWRLERPGDEIRLLPQADGGEGTVDAFAAAMPDSVRRSAGSVTGPDGRPTAGEWLQLADGTAIIELAGPSGLPLMSELDAEGATTRGLGEVMRAAIADGARRLVIGLGGSASTDGGVGALCALGARFRDAAGGDLPDGGGALANLAEIDRSGLVLVPPGGVVLLTDVVNPLLGARGAATVFGPQKGADAGQIASLDRALARFARLAAGQHDASPDMPGAGAAGGTGFGLAAIIGATISPGGAYIAQLSGLPRAIETADVVLTGEGRFDETSLGGKVVGDVLRLANRSEAVVGIIAGIIDAKALACAERPRWTRSLVALAGSTEQALAHPERWLRVAGAEAARTLSPSPRGE